MGAKKRTVFGRSDGGPEVIGNGKEALSAVECLRVGNVVFEGHG